MSSEQTLALVFALIGYAACTALPVPWLSRRMVDAWAAIGAALCRLLRRVTAVAQAEVARTESLLSYPAATASVVLHPDSVAALASAVAAQLARAAQPEAIASAPAAPRASSPPPVGG